MTAQQVFEKTVRFLALQGKQARQDNDSSCLYRMPNEDGNITQDSARCAFGLHIEDASYTKQMEGQRCVDLMANPFDFGDAWACQLKRNPWMYEYKDLFRELQMDHDSVTTWKSQATFVETFRVAAQKYALDGSFLDTLEFGGKLKESS